MLPYNYKTCLVDMHINENKAKQNTFKTKYKLIFNLALSKVLVV